MGVFSAGYVSQGGESSHLVCLLWFRLTSMEEIIGQVLTKKPIYKATFSDVIKQEWKIEMGLEILSLRSDVFVFSFGHEKEKQRVLDIEPWVGGDCGVIPLRIMSLFAWNARGLGNPEAFNSFRRLLQSRSRGLILLWAEDWAIDLGPQIDFLGFAVGILVKFCVSGRKLKARVTGSDHRAIHLNLETTASGFQRRKMRGFMYEPFWPKDTACEDLVRKLWFCSTFDGYYASFIFLLDSCGDGLRS
ncbi:hypothetical protein PanWU01x14_287120 [Parasponia andersonii]|uniref:DUF4283 domain-containing protein n=1 Tax=Parasponia andersonii TaxID=3476 RepID=A0A2P5AYW3_PARAD|nr:hypothetical protein PanWU01x14_287120 [Parasponia andersonii]